MKIAVFLLILLTFIGSQRASAAELSQSQLRSVLVANAKRDFATHSKRSGLSRYVKGNTVPMTKLDEKFRDFVDKRYDLPISRLESKLLVRSPKHIPRIKLVHKLSYAVTERICQDAEAEGNETDSARHFIGAFALALLAGEKFAYQYLTAHESWLLDHNLDEYTGYNFASTIMDLHNNAVAIMAARKYQKSLTLFNLQIGFHTYSLKTIRRLAIKELKEARKQNKLLAVYAKAGACTQVSQREALRNRVGLSSDTEIL